jgi:hypothetical protein
VGAFRGWWPLCLHPQSSGQLHFCTADACISCTSSLCKSCLSKYCCRSMGQFSRQNSPGSGCCGTHWVCKLHSQGRGVCIQWIRCSRNGVLVLGVCVIMACAAELDSKSVRGRSARETVTK